MNLLTINDMKPGSFFTEDAYVCEDLFFLPKNLPILGYHIKLLKAWNIDKIATIGLILDTPGKHQENKEVEDLENVFNNSSNLVTDEADDLEDTSGPVNQFAENYKRWILTNINFFNSVVTLKQVDKDKVINLLTEIKTEITRSKNEYLRFFGKQIEGIPYIHRKTIETTILAYIISNSMNLGEYTITNLLYATLFHDVGMMKISKDVLTKKEQLTKDDINEIQNHTIYGYKLLRDVNYSAIVSSGALQHHERIDGKGYPNHVTAEKITEISKIISVVDAYCAAIAEKPFKNSLHAKEAIQDLLKSGGSAYDSAILRELIKNISFYPIGSFVLLSDGISAEVTGTSGVAMRPIIKTLNKDGHSEIIDLSKRNDIYIKGIYSKGNQSTP